MRNGSVPLEQGALFLFYSNYSFYINRNEQNKGNEKEKEG
jgi:hypothetical protein